jgi:hypothetical protein
MGYTAATSSRARNKKGLKLRKRPVEQFHNVQDFLVGAAHRGAGAELQDAAGIGCGDDLGFGLLHAVHFAV